MTTGAPPVCIKCHRDLLAEPHWTKLWLHKACFSNEPDAKTMEAIDRSVAAVIDAGNQRLEAHMQLLTYGRSAIRISIIPSELVPEGEIHIKNETGEMLGRIINVARDPV